MRADDGRSLPLEERANVPRAGPLLIDCDSCLVRGPACSDCVVTFLLGGPPDPVELHRPHSGAGSVELSAVERGALDALADSGMVPPLRLVTAVAESAVHERFVRRIAAGDTPRT